MELAERVARSQEVLVRYRHFRTERSSEDWLPLMAAAADENEVAARAQVFEMLKRMSEDHATWRRHIKFGAWVFTYMALMTGLLVGIDEASVASGIMAALMIASAAFIWLCSTMSDQEHARRRTKTVLALNEIWGRWKWHDLIAGP